jgi:hypothetical protein
MKIIMKKNSIIHLVILAAMMALPLACSKDQLQVGNPNSPTLVGNTVDEPGITTAAMGFVYINGFVNGDVWLGDTYFSMNYGFSELMADNSGADAANQNISTMNVPDLVTVSDGTSIPTQSRAIPLERTYNNRPATGAGYNYLYYQWLNAYALNNGMNALITKIPGVTFSSGDATTKAATLYAWAYWWKGWAYAAVGSLYYSGLIIDGKVNLEGVTPINNNYVTHDVVIAQSDKYLLKADSVLQTISSTSDYATIMGEVIPPPFQAGKGQAPSVAEWRQNINTMLARNLLVNKLAPVGPAFGNPDLSHSISKSSTTTMTAADWAQVLAYANKGLGAKTNCFAGHSQAANTVFTTTGGTVSAKTAGSNKTTTFKVSERFMQNFHADSTSGTYADAFGGNYDNRIWNFTQKYLSTKNTFYQNVNFGTRWSLYRFKDTSIPTASRPLPDGTYQFADWNDGNYELYIAGSYEENELMKAEANIRLGNVETGLQSIDAVRAYQGAGVNAVAGTGLTQAQAMAELLMERRVALVFRGLAFYDARRWGWTYDVGNGGGVTGVNFLKGATLLKASINYNFLDYWDVPADEFVLNPPAGGDMTKVINPNFD